MEKSYSDLLKDPRWQKKRLEILERDEYKCRSCKAKDESYDQIGKYLNVHHVVYHAGLNPWEYEEEDLITLCDDCHDFISHKIKACFLLVRRICIDDDRSEQLEYLLKTVLGVENAWYPRKIAKDIFHTTLYKGNSEKSEVKTLSEIITNVYGI